MVTFMPCRDLMIDLIPIANQLLSHSALSGFELSPLTLVSRGTKKLKGDLKLFQSVTAFTLIVTNSNRQKMSNLSISLIDKHSLSLSLSLSDPYTHKQRERHTITAILTNSFGHSHVISLSLSLSLIATLKPVSFSHLHTHT